MSEENSPPKPDQVAEPEQDQADQADHADERDQRSRTATTVKPAPTKPRPGVLPPWKVILHNDDDNDVDYVVESIVMLTPLKMHDATRHTFEAHVRGLSLLLTTHKERAELYQQQFASKRLIVTIEPA